MKTVIYDVETDGLLDKLTTVWVIACVDDDGNNRKFFTDRPQDISKTPDGSLEDGVKHILSYDKIVCHNQMSFDWHVFNRFWPDLWNLETVPFKKCWDTLAQSRCQHFDRHKVKGVKGNHGLEYYGVLFKYPKPPIEDWSYFDDDKLERCLVDIEINRKAYHYLNNEAKKIGLDFRKQIRRAQATEYWYAKQEQNGWLADREFLEQCVEELDTEMDKLKAIIEPKLPPVVKPKAPKCTWEDIRDSWDKFFRKVPATKMDDKGKPIKEAYKPSTKIFLKKKKKDDLIKYDRHTAKHFGIDQEARKSNYLIMGPYTKVEFYEAKITQHKLVKDYLLSIGWRPTQWNFKKDDKGKIERDEKGKPIKTSPKLTEDSFETIEGELGKQIATYNTYAHRRRTILNENDSEKGWLNLLRDDGRISAGAMACATSTGRAVQFGIVNNPSAQALYGAPMRQCWIASPGHKIVSVDMDSAQLRLLANYMQDPEFTKAVMEGTEEEHFSEDKKPNSYYEFSDGVYKVYVGTDAHTFNARFFGLIDDEDWMRAKKTQNPDLIKKLSKARKKAKNGIYALLSNRAA